MHQGLICWLSQSAIRPSTHEAFGDTSCPNYNTKGGRCEADGLKKVFKGPCIFQKEDKDINIIKSYIISPRETIQK
jgi:hypothetical protein